MLSPQAAYAIVATGVFLIFTIPASLTIWWRRRMLKAQKANADSFLQENIAPTPGTVGPDGFTASKPGSLYPQKPGGGNVEFLSNSTLSCEGDTPGISPRPSFCQTPQGPDHSHPPPAYSEV